MKKLWLRIILLQLLNLAFCTVFVYTFCDILNIKFEFIYAFAMYLLWILLKS